MRRILAALALAAAAAPAAAQEGRLVLYTSQPNADAQQTVDAFRAAHPDVEVEWIRDGTTKVMGRLRAEFEAGEPQPDVLLIADMATMEGLKQEGRLAAHERADVSAYDEGLYDADRTYFSTKLITTGIVYNTSVNAPPQGYADLLEPPCRGALAMPSPLTSGAATIHMATLTSNPELGWDYHEGLAEAGANPQGGNGGTFRAIAGGEKLCGFVADFLPIREARKGAPVKFLFPPEGVSAVTEPVAILSTAKNLLSPEGQKLAQAQGYIPAHPDVAPPEGFPPRDGIRLMAFDPAEALAGDAGNKARFSEIFGQ